MLLLRCCQASQTTVQNHLIRSQQCNSCSYVSAQLLLLQWKN
jgi:hypothetical protein